MRCAHCDREVTGADLFCPGCGRPLSAEVGSGPAPGEPGTGLPASPLAPDRERSRLGLEATIPLLTGGATVVATGAGLRAQMPGLGTALLVIGALVMAAPATVLLRDRIGGQSGRLPATGKPLLAAVAGSLVAGSLLGVLLVGVVWPHWQAQPPADAAPVEAATACATTSSAEQILQAFAERGLPIGESEVFTAESDPEVAPWPPRSLRQQGDLPRRAPAAARTAARAGDAGRRHDRGLPVGGGCRRARGRRSPPARRERAPRADRSSGARPVASVGQADPRAGGRLRSGARRDRALFLAGRQHRWGLASSGCSACPIPPSPTPTPGRPGSVRL